MDPDAAVLPSDGTAPAEKKLGGCPTEGLRLLLAEPAPQDDGQADQDGEGGRTRDIRAWRAPKRCSRFARHKTMRHDHTTSHVTRRATSRLVQSFTQEFDTEIRGRRPRRARAGACTPRPRAEARGNPKVDDVLVKAREAKEAGPGARLGNAGRRPRRAGGSGRARARPRHRRPGAVLDRPASSSQIDNR